MEQRGGIVWLDSSVNRNMREEPVSVAKPFAISKRMVWEAFKAVKASGGAPGSDGQTLEGFAVNLADNLYRIWNRMASRNLSTTLRHSRRSFSEHPGCAQVG